jgi:hypothetical protein
MERRLPHSTLNLPKRGSPLWLAASHGRRLPRTHELLAAIDEPEIKLEVQFEGLTEAEQRRALKGFPGGKRFTLAHRH